MGIAALQSAMAGRALGTQAVVSSPSAGALTSPIPGALASPTAAAGMVSAGPEAYEVFLNQYQRPAFLTAMQQALLRRCFSALSQHSTQEKAHREWLRQAPQREIV